MDPTPLLDLFKRGEVERDVRMQAAEGTLAPRAHEQLAILVFLMGDPDREIRETADETLSRIPVDVLAKFLARSDVPVDLREFFGDRGIFPAEIPPVEVEQDDPLIDGAADEGDAATAEASGEPEAPDEAEAAETVEAMAAVEAAGAAEAPEDEDADRVSGTQELAAMNFPQRLRAAMKGTREQRAILIRDPNKLICASVLSSPKVSVPEVESFARMQNVSEDVLRIIGSNRAWLKSYGVILALTKNPKTPLALSMNLMGRLTSKDLAKLSVDRNVPEALRISSRKKVVQNQSGKD